MGGRLPANWAFLEFSAVQSDLPKKKSMFPSPKEPHFMVTHNKVMLWHNIIGRLLKPSLPSEIRPLYYSWDLDTNLLRPQWKLGSQSKTTHWAGIVWRPSLSSPILADVIQSGRPTCPNNLQSTYQSGMSDFRASDQLSEITWFNLSPSLPAGPISCGRNFKLQLESSVPEPNLCETPMEESKVAGG